MALLTYYSTIVLGSMYADKSISMRKLCNNCSAKNILRMYIYALINFRLTFF